MLQKMLRNQPYRVNFMNHPIYVNNTTASKKVAKYI